jgi:hypothetical protein
LPVGPVTGGVDPPPPQAAKTASPAATANPAIVRRMLNISNPGRTVFLIVTSTCEMAQVRRGRGPRAEQRPGGGTFGPEPRPWPPGSWS